MNVSLSSRISPARRRWPTGGADLKKMKRLCQEIHRLSCSSCILFCPTFFTNRLQTDNYMDIIIYIISQLNTSRTSPNFTTHRPSGTMFERIVFRIDNFCIGTYRVTHFINDDSLVDIQLWFYNMV